MNAEQIDELQENTLLLKGLTALTDFYRIFKTENPDYPTAEQIDAVEYFLSQTGVKLANAIKRSTDLLA